MVFASGIIRSVTQLRTVLQSVLFVPFAYIFFFNMIPSFLVAWDSATRLQDRFNDNFRGRANTYDFIVGKVLSKRQRTNFQDNSIFRKTPFFKQILAKFTSVIRQNRHPYKSCYKLLILFFTSKITRIYNWPTMKLVQCEFQI